MTSRWSAYVNTRILERVGLMEPSESSTTRISTSSGIAAILCASIVRIDGIMTTGFCIQYLTKGGLGAGVMTRKFPFMIMVGCYSPLCLYSSILLLLRSCWVTVPGDTNRRRGTSQVCDRIKGKRLSAEMAGKGLAARRLRAVIAKTPYNIKGTTFAHLMGNGAQT